MSPRYSIIPGEFATEARADVHHFRVLNLIGRHTNAHGWCRLKQQNIADALDITRETVNRKLKDLVDWGYVDKRVVDATGRAIFYRTVMDRHAPPPSTSDDDDLFLDDAPAPLQPRGPVRHGSHVGYNADAPDAAELHPTCDPSLTSGVSATITPGVSVYDHNKNDLSLTTKIPPNPPRGAEASPCERNEVPAARAIARLAADPLVGEAATALLVPLAQSFKRLSLGKTPERVLAALAAEARAASNEALAAAAKRLTDQPRKITAAMIRNEIGNAVRLGAMVVIRRGSIQWVRWLEYYRGTDPARAKFLETLGCAQVPSEWPPAKSQPSRGAA